MLKVGQSKRRRGEQNEEVHQETFICQGFLWTERSHISCSAIPGLVKIGEKTVTLDICQQCYDDNKICPGITRWTVEQMGRLREAGTIPHPMLSSRISVALKERSSSENCYREILKLSEGGGPTIHILGIACQLCVNAHGGYRCVGPSKNFQCKTPEPCPDADKDLLGQVRAGPNDPPNRLYYRCENCALVRGGLSRKKLASETLGWICYLPPEFTQSLNDYMKSYRELEQKVVICYIVPQYEMDLDRANELAWKLICRIESNAIVQIGLGLDQEKRLPWLRFEADVDHTGIVKETFSLHIHGDKTSLPVSQAAEWMVFVLDLLRWIVGMSAGQCTNSGRCRLFFEGTRAMGRYMDIAKSKVPLSKMKGGQGSTFSVDLAFARILSGIMFGAHRCLMKRYEQGVRRLAKRRLLVSRQICWLLTEYAFEHQQSDIRMFSVLNYNFQHILIQGQGPFTLLLDPQLRRLPWGQILTEDVSSEWREKLNDFDVGENFDWTAPDRLFELLSKAPCRKRRLVGLEGTFVDDKPEQDWSDGVRERFARFARLFPPHGGIEVHCDLSCSDANPCCVMCQRSFPFANLDSDLTVRLRGGAVVARTLQNMSAAAQCSFRESTGSQARGLGIEKRLEQVRIYDGQVKAKTINPSDLWSLPLSDLLTLSPLNQNSTKWGS